MTVMNTVMIRMIRNIHRDKIIKTKHQQQQHNNHNDNNNDNNHNNNYKDDIRDMQTYI